MNFASAYAPVALSHFMDTVQRLQPLVGICLVVLTGLYVVLTYRLFRETKKTNDLSREQFMMHFSLMTLPQVTVALATKSTGDLVNIANHAQVPAYNIAAWIVGQYSDEEFPLEQCKKNELQKEADFSDWTVNEEGFWAIRENLYYPVFPPQKSVAARLYFPKGVFSIWCLLQFQDIRGTNYAQLYWFFLEEESGKSSYRLGDLQPPTLSPCPRIESVTKKTSHAGPKLTTRDGTPLPEFVKSFAATFRNSCSVGFLKDAPPSWEDRGVWSSL